MKKLYALSLFTALVFTRLIGQTGALNYSVSITGTTVSYSNTASTSAFVIDNAGNKWIGFDAGTPLFSINKIQ
jgi:hypothetical protein